MEQEQPVRVGRRLAAIVAADVAGYSRLMGLDEVGTARTLREHRKVTDALVAKHGGRLVKTTGDGVLLEFPSVVDAVECAVAWQAVMAERNQGVREDRRMLFRIGINLGDILIEGDDILGDGVNVAARLEGIAEPGGICICVSWRFSQRCDCPAQLAGCASSYPIPRVEISSRCGERHIPLEFPRFLHDCRRVGLPDRKGAPASLDETAA
jgi:hypothetical protein